MKTSQPKSAFRQKKNAPQPVDAPTAKPPASRVGSIIYSLITIAMLLLALVGVYSSQLTTLITGPTPEPDPVTEGHYYVSDLDFWRRTNREVQISSAFAFDLNHDLNLIPMTLGKWKGSDQPDSNREVEILLEPEQYVRRLYQHEDGPYMWLSLIGGRSSQPFHAPDICYDADGWQYDLGSHSFELSNDGQIYGLWLDAEKQFDTNSDPVEHFVSYFYIFPDKNRNLSDGIVLFKLTSSNFGSLDQNLAMHQDFVGSVFKGIEYSN